MKDKINFTVTLPFILDNVDGNMQIVYSPFGQKFYQNGQEIKRSGAGFGSQKYQVLTTDGGDNVVKVKGSLQSGRKIEFRGETIGLETPLSGLSLILSLLPFLFIAIVAVVLMAGHFGIIGGALLGGCGAFGTIISSNMLRIEKDFTKQLLYSVGIAIASTILFIVLDFVFYFILGFFLGAASSIF